MNLNKSILLIATCLFAGFSSAHAADDAGSSAPASTCLNIKDFGASGDGISDDTPALLKAIKAAESSEGTIYFPAGNYCIHPVKLPSHITLMGHSAWGYENKGRKDPDFEGRTTLSALSGDARALLDCSDARGTRIVGLTLDGKQAGKSMHGIYARHTGCELHLCVEDCRINHFSGSGIRLEKAWVFSIRRCLLMWNGEHGIDCTGGYDGWVIDCMMTANQGAGFFARGEAPEGMDEKEKKAIGFFGCASVMLTADRIEWNRKGGILLNDANSMQVTGCSIDHNFGPGIMMTRATANTISGCTLRSNGVDCKGNLSCQIRLENCNGTAVTGNTLWGWFERKEYKEDDVAPFYGMVVEGLTGCVISQNAMYHSSSKEGIRDLGGHEATVLEKNMYVKPDLATGN